MSTERARTFWLIRDDTIVADGVKFPDNTTIIRWRWARNLKPTTAIHEDLGSVVAIHGNSGIRAQWCDTAADMTAEDTREDNGFA